jgi:4a-hydroxytetrahydrobiopterin dehydratase
MSERPSKLGREEVRAGLEKLPGWTLAGDELHREYRFADFSSAFGFMARTALAAEKLDHHPDWSNSYSRVVVDLSTHDAGGVTALDLALAAEMERLAKASGASGS